VERLRGQRLLSRTITVRRAAEWIAGVTVLFTLAGGFGIWLLDHKEFPTIGAGMWWSVQTMTTVGYGDHVPSTTEGQLVGAAIMIAGIGFLTVVTATVTAAFVEGARTRLGRGRDDEILKRLDRIEQRLAALDRPHES
jgi:voltage-gated potassium channel Kch